MLRWFGFDPSISRGRRIPEIPDGIEILRDPSAGHWIENRLQPWGKEGVTLSSFLPDTFPAYARIYHPFHLGEDAVLDRREEQPVRWSTVAGWTGATVHPLMQIDKVAHVPFPYNIDLDWGECPEMGSLPFPESVSLTEMLRECATTPDACFLGYWKGYGCLNRGTIYLYVPGGGLFPRIEAMIHNMWESRRPIPDPLGNVQTLKGQHRDYILFRGDLQTVPSLSQHPRWFQSPSLWWPEDRAWCVATEIDGYDTFIGGSHACIERILDCPDLEALPLSVDDRIDGGADMINT